MIVDLMSTIAKNFSGIKNVFRVEYAFDLTHRAEQFVTELFAHVFRARDADAVFGRQRTFELLNKSRSLIRNLSEFFQIGGAVQIDHRSNVQQTSGGMSIVGSFESEIPNL